MRAADVMERQFEIVHPDATVEEIAPRLSRNTEPLPVCEGRRLIGLVRPEDLMGEPMPGLQRQRVTRIRDLITPDVVYCLESTEISEAVALMRENDLECLPVLDEQKALVGMLSLRSLPPGTAFDAGAQAGAGR